MEEFSLYDDIAKRTGGDIYIGVVGPVRCGKSTLITKFMQSFVIPNIKSKHNKERATYELPQSADGKTIMTTQPRFVPAEAVKITVANKVDLSVRMVDCVGYLVEGVLGHTEDGAPRLVKTPWSEKEMPFEEAAEFGTKKVIDEHSTIGILVTTDGTISDIPRASYVGAEERVVDELKATGKPFVIVLNTTKPNDHATKKLAEGMQEKYGVTVLAVDALHLDRKDVEEIFSKILGEFPITSLKVKMPDWLAALPFEDHLISAIVSEISKFSEDASKLSQIDKVGVAFLDSEDFEPVVVSSINMGDGSVSFELTPKPALFYRVLSAQCGLSIGSDLDLMLHMQELAVAKVEYDRMKVALDQVRETGYGVVLPTLDDMNLEDPHVIKQGGKYGVKLRASAPSLHIMQVDIQTEITPAVGTAGQSEEMVKNLMAKYENNPRAIWNTDMFGKTLHTMVNEDIAGKVLGMPTEAQKKMRKTLGKIVNEGKGGIICILL